MALAIITVAATSMSSAASAGKVRIGIGWGGHHHNHGYRATRIYVPAYQARSCHYYKKKWQWTGKKYWKNKYKACLILKK
jgi:hypothetical protein